MATPLTSSSSDALDAHIELTSDTCGGKPRIAGTRIRVQDVVIWHERMGISTDEIVSRYPQLTLADVYAALAYYHDRRELIDAQMETGEKLADEIRGYFPSKLPAKLPTDK